jgi:hypothetical protein
LTRNHFAGIRLRLFVCGSAVAKITHGDAKEAGGEEQARLRVATEQHCARWCELIPALRVRFRLLGLLGLLFVAFGPSYSWLLLHLLYGEAWSSTEAPDALAAYCVYVLLMAINGAYTGKPASKQVCGTASVSCGHLLGWWQIRLSVLQQNHVAPLRCCFTGLAEAFRDSVASGKQLSSIAPTGLTGFMLFSFVLCCAFSFHAVRHGIALSSIACERVSKLNIVAC